MDDKVTNDNVSARPHAFEPRTERRDSDTYGYIAIRSDTYIDTYGYIAILSDTFDKYSIHRRYTVDAFTIHDGYILDTCTSGRQEPAAEGPDGVDRETGEQPALLQGP